MASGIYWRTATGQQIDVDDMTESHVRNTLKFLIRKGRIAPFKQEKNDKWSHLYSDHLEEIDQLKDCWDDYT
jgi:hypothetical protein